MPRFDDRDDPQCLDQVIKSSIAIKYRSSEEPMLSPSENSQALIPVERSIRIVLHGDRPSKHYRLAYEQAGTAALEVPTTHDKALESSESP